MCLIFFPGLAASVLGWRRRGLKRWHFVNTTSVAIRYSIKPGPMFLCLMTYAH